jgi:hypothetical protein
MKDQYFGDINDYRKYGLLRALCAQSKLRLGVCWMLTPNDNRSDGKHIGFLDEPANWQRYDVELFQKLKASMRAGRRIAHTRDFDILDDFVEAREHVPDARVAREVFFKRATEQLASAELVFFDPDNGLDVRSRQPGRKNSNKYLVRAELAATFSRGKSVLLYQHFIRENRESFITRIANELQILVQCRVVHTFRTSHVVFFLLPQAAHLEPLTQAAKDAADRWAGQIELQSHVARAIPELDERAIACSAASSNA